MSSVSYFIPNGLVYGVIYPIKEYADAEPIGYIPQSLEPNTVEYYESVSPEQMLGAIDELVAVFPSEDGAKALMLLMYQSFMGDFPLGLMTDMLEDIFSLYGGQLAEKSALGMKLVYSD